MDATRLANLKIEINNLAIWLTAYDTSISNYFNGSSPTCVHFLESILTLNNNNTSSLAYDASYSGQGSSFGALTDFVYEVSSIQRNTAVISANKITYYLQGDLQKSTDADFNSGHSTMTIAYMQGTSPDQGIII